MHSSRRIVLVAALLLLAGGLGAFTATNLAARPTSVAVVDLPRVMDQLTQWADSRTKLSAMKDQMLDTDSQRTQKLDEMRKQLEDLPAEKTADRDTLQEKIAREALDLQAWRMFASEQLDIETSIRLRDADRSIKTAIAQLAQVTGYDIVLSDDSARELTVDTKVQATREQQVRVQMQSRRMLYVNPEVDVTDELIQRMNNAYKSGS